MFAIFKHYYDEKTLMYLVKTREQSDMEIAWIKDTIEKTKAIMTQFDFIERKYYNQLDKMFDYEYYYECDGYDYIYSSDKGIEAKSLKEYYSGIKNELDNLKEYHDELLQKFLESILRYHLETDELYRYIDIHDLRRWNDLVFNYEETFVKERNI